MTDIVLCGDPADNSISEALLPALSLYGGVRYSSEKRIAEFGSSAEFFVYESEKIPKIELPQGIVLFKNGILQQKDVSIPDQFLCVLETKNRRAAGLLKGTGATAVTCGTGAKDTLSIAGLENAGATLSLQRSVTAVDGKFLEPHDFNVVFSKPRSPHQILFVCAALLLAGVDSLNGYAI